MTNKSKLSNTLRSLLRIRELPLLIFILLMVAVLTYSSPAFMQKANFLSLARGFSIEGITLVAMTILLISGVFDISVGGVMALSGVVCSILMVEKVPLPFAILGGIAVGMAFGAFNALVIVKYKVHPFIVTFGTLFIARSIGLAITQGNPIRVNDKIFTFMGTGLVGGIPFAFIVIVILVVLADFAMRRVRFFRQFYFIGGNEGGAELTGINVTRVRVISFIFSGMLAAVSGVLSSARLMGAVPNAYMGIELKLIVAAVIGGCTLKGGEGTIAGSMLGLVFLFLLSNSMTLLGINIYWEPFVLGIFLIIVVLYNMYAPSRLTKPSFSDD